MSVIIKRNTGWMGVGSKIQIRLNGKNVGSVMEKNYIEVEIPEGQANLKVTQFGAKSKEIVVKDGDVIEVTSTMLYRMSIPLILLISFTSTFILNSKYKLNTLVVLYVLGIIYLFLFRSFNLKVVTDKIS